MCADCEARRKMARDALMSAKFGEALGHVAKGAAEIVGIKKKSGADELSARDEPESAVKPRKHTK